MGEQNYGIDVNVARSRRRRDQGSSRTGVQVAVVVGGGNIFRGVSKSAGNMDRSSADYIGMLATVMNAVVLAGCAGEDSTSTRACCRRLIFRNWPSPLFAAAPFVISKRAHRHLCRRHRQSFLHHRLGRRVARPRNQGGRDSQSHQG